MALCAAASLPLQSLTFSGSMLEYFLGLIDVCRDLSSIWFDCGGAFLFGEFILDALVTRYLS